VSRRSDRDGSVLTAALAASARDLLRYLERRVGAQDAADVLGELMVVAWRRASDVPTDAEQARMWLFGIARNLVNNSERSERRQWRLADKLRSVLDRHSAPPSDDGLDVRDAVDRLGGDAAELIRLVHWDGFTLVEAAELLGINASTARSRYKRAKDSLREALAVPAEKWVPAPLLPGRGAADTAGYE
jgi:RNA polymerase sigma factor (sigma-70 family)